MLGVLCYWGGNGIFDKVYFDFIDFFSWYFFMWCVGKCIVNLVVGCLRDIDFFGFVFGF